jgi:Fur family peroxide stress response transcriptional regulator
MVDPDKRLEELTHKLRRSNYRLTPQRMAVIKFLVNTEEHPSVVDIYEVVSSEFPMTSLGTIYKTITMLKDMGEILELGFSHDSSRYDARMPDPHPHLICIQCKRIIHPDANVQAFDPKNMSQSTGYQVENYRLDFYGICPQCQEQD